MFQYATLFIWLAFEAYFWFAIRATFTERARKNVLLLNALSIGFVGLVFVLILTDWFPEPNATRTSNLLLGFAFVFMITKTLGVMLFFAEDLIRLIRKVFVRGEGADHSRRRFVRNATLATMAIPFSGLLYGIFRGKYAFKVRTLSLYFPDLPEAFDGFKIAQISDVHSGSFDNTDAVRDGVEMIGKQGADVILFTGDMVNLKAEETTPYVPFFKKLKAPFGKYSVLGNHDYGNYYNGLLDTPGKQENMQKLKEAEAEMGFKLLLNEHVRLEKDGQSICLTGVENWGADPFPQEGDLDKALDGVSQEEFTILMSHDPTHWDKFTLSHKKQVHLTLAGHTHGAQMGVEIPWLKFSPAQFVYPRWGGLYTEGKEHLYVNRGFGFIGYPGRAGIWPEIAVIELKRGTEQA